MVKTIKLTFEQSRNVGTQNSRHLAFISRVDVLTSRRVVSVAAKGSAVRTRTTSFMMKSKLLGRRVR